MKTKHPCLLVDAYKLGHYFQMPNGVKTIYSTWTARSNKFHPNCENTVVFGHQGFLMEYFRDYFNNEFFSADIDKLEEEYVRKVSAVFHPRYTDFSRFRELHALGYLPIAVWGVPEGTVLPINIPDHVLYNTDERFAWLPQYLEDLWSCHNWPPSTSATTAYYRRKLLAPYVQNTCGTLAPLAHMCGDFSMRGMTGEDAAFASTAGHLLSFDRTATVEGNGYLEEYYGAKLEEGMTPGLGVPSLEHSVVCQNVAYYKELLAENRIPDYMKPYVKTGIIDGWETNLIAEMCFILRLLTEVQPTGMLTYVSDTYDYWSVVSKILPVIKDVIMKRDGCFSIRPDSGKPVNIICGNRSLQYNGPERQGTLNTLLDIFGYTENSVGCKVLPPQIRMIYGDAITAEITKEVGEWCVKNNVAISNIAFGIGAFTYQYVTRDTRGFAIKATDAVFEDLGEINLYKDPKTDSGKKSPRGAVAVVPDEIRGYHMVDRLTMEAAMNYPDNIMVKKFENGKMTFVETIYDIRNRLWDGQF